MSEIADRLKAMDEHIQISGLLALRNIVQASEFEVDTERMPLNRIVDMFFPLLEQIMTSMA